MTFKSKSPSMQGDLIPWTVGQQFQDPDFPNLSGARIVRIATHPELTRAGYGTAAVAQLRRYFQGAYRNAVCPDAIHHVSWEIGNCSSKQGAQKDS